MDSQKKIIFRMYVVFFLIVLGFIYVTYILFHVQITRHDELLGKAMEKYTAKSQIKAYRGQIFDNQGNLLVTNTPTIRLTIDPQQLEEEDYIPILKYLAEKIPNFNLKKVGAAITKKTTTTKNSVTQKETVKKNRYVAISDNLEYNLGLSLYQEIRKTYLSLYQTKDVSLRKENQNKARKFGAIGYENTSVRTYLKGSLLANILGFVQDDGEIITPIDGLEYYLNDYLKKENGYSKFQMTRKGVPIMKLTGEGKQKKAVDGMDVYLTIQEPIQEIVEDEIDKLMARTQANGAVIIMANPFTGDIMAAAQRPTFNPSDMGKSKDFLNRFTSMKYEPGSTMKPITVSYALDRGFVTPQTKFFCERKYWAQYRLHDDSSFGDLTVNQIIQKSSNIGTAKIALEMGKENLYQALRMFGFGEKTNIELGRESIGSLKNVDKWDRDSLTRFSFGQGVTVTPLQMVRAYCMLANGGYKLDLRIVDHYERGIDIFKMPIQKDEISSFKKESTAKYISEMLRSVTEPGGTGTLAAIQGFHVAGKTGTAQKVVPKGKKMVRNKDGALVEKTVYGYADKLFYASFCGFAPVNHPEFVLIVIADEPHSGNTHGGPACGPTFQEIAKRTLCYLSRKKDVSDEEWLAEWNRKKKIEYEIRLAEDKRVAERRRINALSSNTTKK